MVGVMLASETGVGGGDTFCNDSLVVTYGSHGTFKVMEIVYYIRHYG